MLQAPALSSKCGSVMLKVDDGRSTQTCFLNRKMLLLLSSVNIYNGNNYEGTFVVSVLHAACKMGDLEKVIFCLLILRYRRTFLSIVVHSYLSTESCIPGQQRDSPVYSIWNVIT